MWSYTRVAVKSVQRGSKIYPQRTAKNVNMQKMVGFFIIPCHGRNYDEFAYNLVILRTQNFVASTLSGFYFHLVKDRLYCDHPNSIARRSAVTTLSLGKNIFTINLNLIAIFNENS